MGTTSLVEELTKTYFPPPLTHLSAQALCPALAPFAPQPLSLIHPVHESAFTGMLKAKNKTAAIARVENTFFMFIPLPLGAEILILSLAFVNRDHANCRSKMKSSYSSKVESSCSKPANWPDEQTGDAGVKHEGSGSAEGFA